MEIITCKLDVKKITKSKLFEGAKGTYLSCTLVPTPNSEYGDYMIVEETTKEERDAGNKGMILGNAKVKKPKAETTHSGSTAGEEKGTPDSDLPFFI